jgi:hypothetical protein
VLLNLKEFRVQEEDLCKECTKPTIRQSVEILKLSKGSSKSKECARSKVVSLYKLRRLSIEHARKTPESILKDTERLIPLDT